MTYERRIGRYAGPLGKAFAAMLPLRPGIRVLDVGCGSGALTAPLSAAVGPTAVTGLDPSPADLALCRQRVPGVELVVGTAERMSFASASFDVVAAQLVVGLVDDPVAAVAEMHRVCRPGGTVAACVWDFGQGMTVLRAFWDAAVRVVPSASEHDQSRSQQLTRAAELAAAWQHAGLTDVSTAPLVVEASYAGIDDLWEPLLTPDGAPGRFLRSLSASRRDEIQAELVARLRCPAGPFALTARAWSVLGRAGDSVVPVGQGMLGGW